jgi:hypothetical protein
MNLEQLQQYAAMYLIIEEKAEKVFDKIDKLAKKYSSERYFPTHTLRRFDVASDYIYLYGDDHWNEHAIEYSMRHSDFINDENYLKALEERYQAEDRMRKEKEAEKAEADKQQKLRNEYMKFLELNEKFGQKNN